MSEEGQSGRLAALAADARAAGKLALDTEFMGEGRYRTLLCLVQLAIPEGMASSEHIAVIDPLEDDLDGSALAAVLADPAVEIVVHAGRQDIALMRRCFQTDVTNVFDTQVAAGFAGLGAQASYDSLLADILGLRVAKTASFTRWDARPLSSEQMAYAREDVVHLLELAAELERRLSALERRARAGGDLRASAPRQRPQRHGAADRTRAGRVARGHGRAPESHGPERALGRDARGDSPPPSVLAGGSAEDPGSRLSRQHPPGAGRAWGRRAGRRAPAGPTTAVGASTDAEARRRPDDRARRGPPACPGARGRPGL